MLAAMLPCVLPGHPSIELHLLSMSVMLGLAAVAAGRCRRRPERLPLLIDDLAMVWLILMTLMSSTAGSGHHGAPLLTHILAVGAVGIWAAARLKLLLADGGVRGGRLVSSAASAAMLALMLAACLTHA